MSRGRGVGSYLLIKYNWVDNGKVEKHDILQRHKKKYTEEDLGGQPDEGLSTTGEKPSHQEETVDSKREGKMASRSIWGERSSSRRSGEAGIAGVYKIVHLGGGKETSLQCGTRSVISEGYPMEWLGGGYYRERVSGTK